MEIFDVKTILAEHPLEAAFDVEAGTTEKEVIDIDSVELATVDAESGDLPEHYGYDTKDQTIEEQLDHVYKRSLVNASILTEEMHLVEGKYKARMGEVVATNMNVALNAIVAKSRHKLEVDKIISKSVPSGTAAGAHTTNNNLVVASHDEILKMLSDMDGSPNKE